MFEGAKCEPIECEIHPGGSVKNEKLKPNAISARCGYCSRSIVLNLRYLGIGLPHSEFATAACPACSKIHEISMHYNGRKVANNKIATTITMFPAPTRRPKIQLPHEFPERIARAIEDTTASFDDGRYSPALTSARRALEGIFKHLNADETEEGKKLYDLIETTKSADALTSPIADLAHAIRKGGNLGAHFDMDVDPDRQTAELVIQLLAHLISYFYLIPQDIAEIEGNLAKSVSS